MTDTQALEVSEHDEKIARAIAIQSAPAWMPNPGENVTGTVVGFRTYTDPKYGPSPVIVIQKNDGEYLSVALFAQILKERMFQLKPKIGEVVTIAYQGKLDNRKDAEKKYHSYSAWIGDGPDESELSTSPW